MIQYVHYRLYELQLRRGSHTWPAVSAAFIAMCSVMFNLFTAVMVVEKVAGVRLIGALPPVPFVLLTTLLASGLGLKLEAKREASIARYSSEPIVRRRRRGILVTLYFLCTCIAVLCVPWW